MLKIISFLFSLHFLFESGHCIERDNCKFAASYCCNDFLNINTNTGTNDKIESYMEFVMKYEGQFSQPGIGYDAISGYTYDGHALNYTTGELYGEPHQFSAPSKESIHVSILSLAIDGNDKALTFVGGLSKAIELLELKIKGYEHFNSMYPAYGCFTPWVSFNESGIYVVEDWTNPYRVPGLDNGEWFWALYGAMTALEKHSYTSLASKYRRLVNCQKRNAKTIFYRGSGDVSAVVEILDPFSVDELTNPNNYKHVEGQYLNDPYEGETMTQLMYLFSDFKTEEERNMLWMKKREMLEPVFYKDLVLQKGYWFSTHEQWKLMLLPYMSSLGGNDPFLNEYRERFQIVKKLYQNAEIMRTQDAALKQIPGLFASINDVTNGSEVIPGYISATGVEYILENGTVMEGFTYEEVLRTDVVTPYASYALMMQNLSVGLCWYNNMLQAPRMQNKYGSTEAINVNGTEISPLITWDSKITTVLAMLGGIGPLVEIGLKAEFDELYGNKFHKFVYIVSTEYDAVFGELINKTVSDSMEYAIPSTSIPHALTNWNC